MKIITYPSRNEWSELIKRPTLDVSHLYGIVQDVLNDVRENGNNALIKYEEKFDKINPESFQLQVTEEEINLAVDILPYELKEAIKKAKENITVFHSSQKFQSHFIETTPGVICWQKVMPIEKIGLYIPGGSAPLFSTVLMLAVPAKIAGCREIVLCTPPDSEGKVNPAILYAAHLAGVNRIYKVGGSQAIAAMAYGTETISKVFKIFGPGNQYVTAAKQLVSLRDVAIDMPAGPSEVEVIADEYANPEFIAADFLSQAEHGPDSQSVLLTTSENIIPKVVENIENQLSLLPRKEIAEKALSHSLIILLKDAEEVIELTNMYAPEHLIIQTETPLSIADKIENAGSIFLGAYTPESAGDYASGTNHTLPTNGYAKAYSGVNLDSFIKKMTFQEISSDGIKNLGKTIQTMARAEHLDAHANAITIRLKSI